MRTLIFTIAQNGYATAFLPCIASQRAYAKRLGAQFVAITKPARVSNTALSAWLKIPVMLHALEAGYDWVVYIDADCEVKRDAPDFREDLAGQPGNVFMAEGRSGRINSGVMIARRSDESIGFYRQVLSSVTQPVPEEDRASLKYENGNVIFVNRTRGGVDPLDVRWNNTNEPDLDDFIRHYTGRLRPLLKRSPWREAQYQILKRVGSRQLLKFQRQPERRDDEFLASLDEVESAAQAAFPALVAAR